MGLGSRRKFCCIGGGTGLFTLLSGLRVHCPSGDVSAVVSMMDSGGSTGRLRVEHGTLPPGDVRQCLIALSDAPSELLQLMGYRFETGEALRGHNLGNLVLTAAKDLAGGEYEAIRFLERILQVRGHVFPVTLQDCQLVAELDDGSELVGEAQIDVRGAGELVPISRVRLTPPASVFERAAIALLGADYIIVGPGDLYTSVLPNFAVDGLPAAVHAAKHRGARLIYVVNTMTKRGETDGYSASRFVEVIEGVLGSLAIDAVVINTGRVPQHLLENYAVEGAQPVLNDLSDERRVIVTGDLMARQTFARHDSRRLAKAVLAAVEHLPPRPRPGTPPSASRGHDADEGL